VKEKGIGFDASSLEREEISNGCCYRSKACRWSREFSFSFRHEQINISCDVKRFDTPFVCVSEASKSVPCDGRNSAPAKITTLGGDEEESVVVNDGENVSIGVDRAYCPFSNRHVGAIRENDDFDLSRYTCQLKLQQLLVVV